MGEIKKDIAREEARKIIDHARSIGLPLQKKTKKAK